MAPDDHAGHPAEDTAASTRRAQELYASASADVGLTGVAADLQRLCRAVVAGLPVAGAVVHLVPGRDSAGVAAASTSSWRLVGDLVDDLGEAPCLDASRMLRPVLVPDLAPARHRWPVYVQAVEEHGVVGIFSLPVQVGAVSLGVLDLYATTRCSLTPHDLALALALARVATAVLLTGVHETRGRGVAVDRDTDPVSGLLADLDVSLNRAEVHQAQGMVMVVLGVSLAEALLLMRARAFALGRPLADLARDVLSGVVDPKKWGDDSP